MVNSLFKGLLGLLIVSLVFYLSPAPFALANPVGGNVSSGSASIASAGKTETIDQTTSKAVIDWTGFNINSGETTKFVQPNSSSLTVNRVHDMNPSQIFGSLTANGNLVLINPNGVFFGPSSKVDVNGLLATTSNVANSNVMSGGAMHFTPGGNANASVVNAGTITAADAGLVGLVAPNVQNSGIITAKLGKVQLASGDSFDLDFYGDNLLNIGVSDAVQQQIVQNLGMIEADGGTVKLTAAAGRSIVNSLIDVEGQIKTPAFKQQNGVIEIYAAGSNAVPGNVAANKGLKTGSSAVTVSGNLDASGSSSGETGGSISVLGDNVSIQEKASIDASGAAGGGNIKIGGDFHGAGTTPTALNTNVEQGATINANATDSGNGGNVAVWSDYFTSFAGTILAKGGLNAGNGGYVETSGHKTLNMQGTVDASAPHGLAGTWLMDPEDVNITNSDSDDTGTDGGAAFGPGGTQATASVNAQYIVDALNAGTNVTVTTSNNGQSGPNGGSITVSSPINATGQGTALSTTGSLTLSSYKDIIANAAITLGGGTNLSSQTVAGGNLTLDSANSGNNIGAIQVNANIATNGGNITLGGGNGPITAGTASTPATGFAVGDATIVFNDGFGDLSNNGVTINNSSVNSGAGNIIINGQGYGSAGSNASGGIQLFNSSASLQSTSGNITLNGIGGSGTGTYGVEVVYNGAKITSASGSINVIGTGGTGSSGDNVGVYMYYGSGASISSTGSAPINLTGIAGTGGSNNYGIELRTNTSGTGTIGGASDTGNITFETDSIFLTSSGGSSPNIQTSGSVTFAPYTANTNIGVAGGVGGLQITSGAGSILGSTSAGNIVIGNSGDTGTTTIGSLGTATPISFVTGSLGSNVVSGALTGTDNGSFAFTGPTTLSNNIATANQAITFNSPVTLGGNSSLNAGSGALSFGSAVDGGSNLTANAGTITLGGAWGGNVPLGAVSLTSTNGLTFPAINAASVFAETTGGAADITLNGNIAAGGSAVNAITLASGRNFINNSGSNSPLMATSSNWLVYSIASADDTNGASVMSPAKTIYSDAYPDATGVSGNTWVYSSNRPAGGGSVSNSGGSQHSAPPVVTPPTVVAPTLVVTEAPAQSAIPETVQQVVVNTPAIWNSDNVVNDPNNVGISFVNQPAFATNVVDFQAPANNAPALHSATPSDSEAVEPSPISGDSGSAPPAASNSGDPQPNGSGDGNANQKKKEDDKKAKAREQSRLRDLRERYTRAGRLFRLRVGDSGKPDLQPAS